MTTMKKVEETILAQTTPESVIRAFTDPDQLLRWWGVERTLLGTAEGGPYTLTWGISPQGFGFVSSGVITHLDPAGRRELAEVLEMSDTTMLLVTHDLPFALELCPRSVVLNQGMVVADGRTAEILGDPGLMSANRLELPLGFDPSRLDPA